MEKHNLLRKITIGIASLALICPLALSGYNNTAVSASKKIRSHRVYKHRRASHKVYKHKRANHKVHKHRKINHKARHPNKLSAYKQGQLQAKKDFHKILEDYLNNSNANQILFDRITNNKALSKNFKNSSYTKGFLKTFPKCVNKYQPRNDGETDVVLSLSNISSIIVKDAHKYMNSHNKIVKLALRDGAYDEEDTSPTSKASLKSDHLYKTNKLYAKIYDNALAQD